MHKQKVKKQQQQQQKQHHDEALSEYLRPTKMPKTTSRKHMAAPAVPPPPPLPPTTITTNRNNNGIYVIGNTNNALHDDDHDVIGTLERGQRQRLSWMNMRRKGEPEDTMTATISVTPSPQTTRSLISGVSTTMVGGAAGSSHVTVGCAGGGGGTVSGRNTSASCRTITNSSSNNTLNDIVSDYHSHEAGSSDYQYSSGGNAPSGTSSPIKQHISSTSSFTLANGSQVKLLSATDDEKNQQTKCSIFRGLVLCVCLNLSYANVVRFPRELDRYGSVFLIPYMLLLFLVGLPVILLEVSVGQFLGQGAAHTWRASPIFKGASIISRFASWLSTIWISLQAVVALSYACMFLFSTFPLRECAGNPAMTLLQDGYTVTGNSGQECLQNTFLTPFWGNPLYFGLLSIGIICLWILIMLCTHSGKILRRSLFCMGLCGFMLLCTLTGWEIRNSVVRSYFPSLWPFDSDLLLNSGLWFDALMQVIFATNCGFGALPMVTGKFLYKGDAVRTSIVYLCFNLLITALGVTLFVVQFEHSANNAALIDELKPLTAIYDRIIYGEDSTRTMLIKLLPALIYILIVLAALVSLTVAIYTVTRLVPRHPNYVVGLVALVMSIIAYSAPKFIIARLLDRRIVGTLSITALVFELIAITWIYGAKNIYTDLEFSIGRPIFKGWMWLWCICPAILTAILVWWCSDDDQYDLLADYMPRWGPIIFALAIIFLIACIQIFRQVEYNFFGMICEASKSAKEWGPADPLARHAWKQWRSVCQDTGRRDFTLRRRGTRDYTHSIKKGQYSSTGGTKYANGGLNQHQHMHHNHNHHHHLHHSNTQSNWKSSTPGNSSPNYSGSMFGDSAIEEDISVEKFPGITQQQQQQQNQNFLQFHSNNIETNKALRNSNHASTRAQQRLAHAAAASVQQKHQHHIYKRTSTVPVNGIAPAAEKHREVVYIRRLSDDGQQHATRIEITPSNESITYAGTPRNPLVRSSGSHGNEHSYVKRSASTGHVEQNSNNLRHTSGSSSGNSSCTKLPPTITANIGGTGGGPTDDTQHQNVNGDHICWRKFSVNVREYSTEL